MTGYIAFDNINNDMFDLDFYNQDLKECDKLVYEFFSKLEENEYNKLKAEGKELLFKKKEMKEYGEDSSYTLDNLEEFINNIVKMDKLY